MSPRKNLTASAPVTDSVSSRVSRALRKAASKKLSAFTLVELIVVITILAILATIGFLALSGYSQDAKDASVKANVRSVMTAISAESAVTNNSPRYYVVHEAGASLANGTVAFVDGSPVTLTGGTYGTAGTNYSAGNPDWAKLKLNPDKFRLSSLPARLASAFGNAQAAYDSKLVSVGAVDAALAPTANGRSRSASFFQVTGTAPATKMVSVAGNFPSPTATQVSSSGAATGLVKAPTGTGALVDGGISPVAIPIIVSPVINNGYFLLTNNKYSGNLGGISGANTICRNEILNNDFKASSSDTISNVRAAVNSGQARVVAWLQPVSYGTGQHFKNNKSYNFGTLGNSSAGGDIIEINSSGYGPGNSNLWSANTKFGTTDKYWANFESNGGSDYFYIATSISGTDCNKFTSLTGSGNIGDPADANNRFVPYYGPGLTALCSSTQKILCIVDPITW